MLLQKFPTLFFAFGALAFSGCVEVSRHPSSLTLYPPQVDRASGKVTINGVDALRPIEPFAWSWGDGHIELGWFPLTHVYENRNRDYLVTVVARYESGASQRADVVVAFLKKAPNQSPEPTSPSVTDRAGARSAPAAAAAHL